jgi:hypothetical protein
LAFGMVRHCVPCAPIRLLCYDRNSRSDNDATSCSLSFAFKHHHVRPAGLYRDVASALWHSRDQPERALLEALRRILVRALLAFELAPRRAHANE